MSGWVSADVIDLFMEGQQHHQPTDHKNFLFYFHSANFSSEKQNKRKNIHNSFK